MFTTRKQLRPLNNADREWPLAIKSRVGESHAAGRVIRMNSTYLEMVDGFYSNRGMMSSAGIFGIVAISLTLGFFLYVVVFRCYLDPDWNRQDEVEMLLAFGSITLVGSLFILGIFKFYLHIGEWFRYTHYPMRFNRQNRMVYVFRGDDTVLEASWDDLYFNLAPHTRIAGVRIWAICGLVLKDEQTVEELFGFGYVSDSRDHCLHHWEFVRRYMEEGPQAVIGAPGFSFCLPIADKRETLYQGWIALVAEDASNPILKWLMFPIHVTSFLGRLIHRATSKVPLWPADVEVACRIAPDDPYVRDSSTNPVGYR